jgi:hypothetical protein
VFINHSSFTALVASEKPLSFKNGYSITGTKVLTLPVMLILPNLSKPKQQAHGLHGPTYNLHLSLIAGKTSINVWKLWLKRLSD